MFGSPIASSFESRVVAFVALADSIADGATAETNNGTAASSSGSDDDALPTVAPAYNKASSFFDNLTSGQGDRITMQQVRETSYYSTRGLPTLQCICNSSERYKQVC